MCILMIQSCSQPRSRTVSLTFPETLTLVSHKGIIHGKGYADIGVPPGWVTLVFRTANGKHKAVTFKVDEDGKEVYLDLEETSLSDVLVIEQ